MNDPSEKQPGIRWPALLIWLIVWPLLFLLDPVLDLANLSMLLLLGSVAASVWLSPAYSVAASTLFVIAFNWFFIPPRGSFHVTLDKHLLLLVTMVVVNGLIAVLMVMQRQLAIKFNDHRLRTTLLTAVSHDFRTPLATIIGNASSLQDQYSHAEHSDEKKQLSVIIEQANQLNRITSNVLQLVRLDEKYLQIKMDWESAEEIVGAAVHLCRQRAAGRTIEAAVPLRLPLIRCNALLVVQMLRNPIDNAIRHSPPDEPVRVTAIKDGKYLAFAVSDKGVGIAPEKAQTIFEAFERLEPDNHRRLQLDDPTVRGAGIGLALCQAIAKVHEGLIRLNSKANEGSTFTVLLPIRDHLHKPLGT